MREFFIVLIYIFSVFQYFVIFLSEKEKELIGKMGNRSQTASGSISNSIRHPTLGDIEIFPHQEYSQTFRARLKRTLESKEQYEHWKAYNKKFLQSQEFREIFYLPESHEYKEQAYGQSGFCSRKGYVQMQFEYYKHSLSTEINYRFHSSIQFQEKELWYLLYNMIEGSFMMANINKCIADIHPNHILLNQQGRIKMLYQGLLPGQTKGYEKIIEEKISDVFLAPEEMDNDLVVRGIYPNIDRVKADLFSIGLTILMAATLSNSYYLYDRHVLQINQAKLEDTLKEVKRQYSTYFHNILKNLLEINPKNRRPVQEIFTQLNQYEDEILSFKPFTNKSRKHQSENNIFQEGNEASILDFLTKTGEGDQLKISQDKESLALLMPKVKIT